MYPVLNEDEMGFVLLPESYGSAFRVRSSPGKCLDFAVFFPGPVQNPVSKVNISIRISNYGHSFHVQFGWLNKLELVSEPASFTTSVERHNL